MALSIIVMGAAGRMGSTIARLVQEADDLVLAAVLERPESEDRHTLDTRDRPSEWQESHT